MRDPSRVRVDGPLEPFASGFTAELAGLGYKPTSAALQLRLLAHVSRWLAGGGLTADDLTADVVGRFVAARRAAGHTTYSSDRALAAM